MSDPRCWLQLSRRQDTLSVGANSSSESSDPELHKLEAAHVHRTGTANVPARGQRSLPNLLGVQPAAPRRASQSSDSYYALDVPGGRGGRLHVSFGGKFLCPQFLVEGAAED